MADRLDNGARQAQLDFLARCNQAFTPFAPIDLPEFFAGRIGHVDRLISEIEAPGRHVAIFGERGVGKTSLAKLAYFFLRKDEDDTHFISCTRASTFDTLMTDVLASAGVEAVLDGLEAEGQRQATLGGPNLGGTFGASRRIKKTYRRLSAGPQITPRLLLQQFGGKDGLIVIDEYDRVEDEETHTRIAELIKAFSDAAAKTKIIVVGVADTLAQLIGEHASLSRSLAQIKLDRMSDDELRDIIKRGCAHLDVDFPDAIATRITRLADGFPYFVHLLCRHACHRAPITWFRSPTKRRLITEFEYQSGLRDAIDNVEHSLEEHYENSVITTRRRSDVFSLLLGALALSNERDVQVQDLVANMSWLGGTPLKKPSAYSFHLGQLIGERRGKVFTKVRDGYYKFTNPLMRPYVRFRLELENWRTRDGQMQFPFMQPTPSSSVR
ncbi:MAG: ATP-binding protein [Planctomycetes bacterium]|nr:ATP-binding protein [Planctomycetota bacterium]